MIKMNRYKNEFKSQIKITHGKNQFFTLVNKENKSTKSDFEKFIKSVAEFYQKTVSEVY